MIEYQILLNVYLHTQQGGRTVKQSVRCTDRDAAVKKFQYLDSLIKDGRAQVELKAWTEENLGLRDAIITSLDGLYGVAYIKVM